jgi:hypothetical protein
MSGSGVGGEDLCAIAGVSVRAIKNAIRLRKILALGAFSIQELPVRNYRLAYRDKASSSTSRADATGAAPSRSAAAFSSRRVL